MSKASVSSSPPPSSSYVTTFSRTSSSEMISGSFLLRHSPSWCSSSRCWRSKKEPLIISEEDVRENVVTYDDEGRRARDTEAFDIAALRNPAGAVELKFRRDAGLIGIGEQVETEVLQ
ncbi:hypothetical protein CRUP_005935 [Coryphaenoides rupestris]|nr:hypothetical protein CRUP_005935 [Coryphaenoides rupestris]